MWGRWQWAQLGLPHLKILRTQANVAPKIPNLTGLTMNPGASWMSSVGTVRSRIAASPNTSSTIGTARVKRWAMKGKWAVSPFLRPGWKFKPRHSRWERSGFPVHRCYHSLRVIHASPPVCLVFYISLELAEPEFEFMVLLHVPDPPFAQRMKATPRLLVLRREKCFYLSQNCWTDCCSFPFLVLHTPKLIEGGGLWWLGPRLLHRGT